MGVLHSKLFQFLYKTGIQGGQRVIPQIKATNLYDLPFPISQTSQQHLFSQNTISNLVEKIIELTNESQKVNLDIHRQQIQRAIDHADKQIDQLVYELYGLTEEEIKIVETR